LTSGVAGEYIEITARTVPKEPSLDERIVYKITIKQDQFVHEK